MTGPNSSDVARLRDRLESAMVAGDVAWWEFEVDSGAVRFHENEARMLGHPPERFERYEDFLDLVHPDQRESVVEAMHAHLEGQTPRYDVEYRIRTAAGDYRWFHDVGAVTERDLEGAPVRVTGIVTDVTTRLERERALDRLRRRSQALMHTQTRDETARVAIDAAHEVIGAPLSGMHFLDESGETLEAGVLLDSVEEVFDGPLRYARDAPPGTRAALVWEAFESGEPVVVEDTATDERLSEPSPAGSALIHPIGDHGVFVAAATEPHAYDETDLALVEILATTLTAALDRVERERRLRERERRLERLHEATRGLIRAETRSEVAERVTAAAEDILEFSLVTVRLYDPEESGLVLAAGSDAVEELLPDRPAFTAVTGGLNWKTYETGEPGVYDDIHGMDEAVDSGGVLRSLITVPLGGYGTLAAAEATPSAFDETDVFLARILATAAETALEAVDHEAELRSQRDELERQNQRLDEFASVVSHDLRNPLNVIQGSLELARETGEDAHFERTARAADRMETLIDDLLVLARAGQEMAEPEPVELGALTEQCWETVDTGLATLTVASDLTVFADETRLVQLLENLLRNSVEHGSTSPEQAPEAAERGGPGVHVTVGALEDGSGFYVEDDGPGIPPEDRECVFESGYSTAHDGTGFGLRIVRQIADAHGWEVRVTEGSEGGARFELTGVRAGEAGNPEESAGERTSG